ncbi:MAG: asparagine synthetase B [Bacteroidales bacterium]|nr:asparagine synthetase B [Bacteroidales bacterium]MCF8343922.1 asparagine synthetase B [Bacteroidales bacterium]MCF8376344.1 asparagine synthetase B [Bacteroidales bacterium]MCF8400510.1 asparagine synthetase B [Bacteroidales bacterium]
MIFLMLSISQSRAAQLLIPMDDSQRNHLKAYGVAYWVLQHDIEISWLLNYRGGSYLFPYTPKFEEECQVRGVSYEVIADVQASSIRQEIAQPEVNMDDIKLHKVPKIAVYSPKNKQPWDDAVTLALTYAEIPYNVIYDDEVLEGALPMYDWLHLHHEDFTGQYGKFWARYKDYPWYQEDVRVSEEIARRWGYKKVSELKLAVAEKIREFTAGGGYLFAMCSAPDSYDVALAANNVDICAVMFDGDPPDPNAQQQLQYQNCFAFEDFSISMNPYEYEISSIDVTQTRPKSLREDNDFFTLFEFSAKWDPVPTMLCQNHETVLKGFMGQTTAFNKNHLKSDVLLMGENKSANEARYIHGEFGNGTWTFLGGHDPEDYHHYIGDPPTELDLHQNSPGYRLILNNILFPAAKKQKRKT